MRMLKLFKRFEKYGLICKDKQFDVMEKWHLLARKQEHRVSGKRIS